MLARVLSRALLAAQALALPLQHGSAALPAGHPRLDASRRRLRAQPAPRAPREAAAGSQAVAPRAEAAPAPCAPVATAAAPHARCDPILKSGTQSVEQTCSHHTDTGTGATPCPQSLQASTSAALKTAPTGAGPVPAGAPAAAQPPLASTLPPPPPDVSIAATQAPAVQSPSVLAAPSAAKVRAWLGV